LSRCLSVAAQVMDQLVLSARADQPLECCGLLGGPHEAITEIFPTTNALESQHEFFIAPRELIAVLRMLRERGLRHLGIYHSHPDGDNTPSRRDIAMAFYPSCAYVIVSPKPHAARPVRAFQITNGNVTELEIQAVFPVHP
jgi:[CysO sulfur-carrier protein]-S-L-cysteine hydrolase